MFRRTIKRRHLTKLIIHGLHSQMCIRGDRWQSDLGRNKLEKLRRCLGELTLENTLSKTHFCNPLQKIYNIPWSTIKIEKLIFFRTAPLKWLEMLAHVKRSKWWADVRCQTFPVGKATPALQANYPLWWKCKCQIVDERRRGHQLGKFEIIFLCGICHFTSGQISTY